MKITRCKLIRKQQLRLLEFFVLEITARSSVAAKYSPSDTDAITLMPLIRGR